MSDSSIDERDPTSKSPHNRERKPGHGRRENETSFDSSFTTPGVVYFASSGDQPGVQYPAASPNVVAAGGTTTARNPFTANFLSERAWDLTGRGLSAFEARSAELV